MITLTLILLIICIVVALLVLLSGAIWAILKTVFTMIFFPIAGLIKLLF